MSQLVSWQCGSEAELGGGGWGTPLRFAPPQRATSPAADILHQSSSDEEPSSPPSISADKLHMEVTSPDEISCVEMIASESPTRAKSKKRARKTESLSDLSPSSTETSCNIAKQEETGPTAEDLFGSISDISSTPGLEEKPSSPCKVSTPEKTWPTAKETLGSTSDLSSAPGVEENPYSEVNRDWAKLSGLTFLSKGKLARCTVPNCKFTSPSFVDVLDHMSNVHNATPFRFDCHLCPALFAFPENFLEHYCTDHPDFVLQKGRNGCLKAFKRCLSSPTTE